MEAFPVFRFTVVCSQTENSPDTRHTENSWARGEQRVLLRKCVPATLESAPHVPIRATMHATPTGEHLRWSVPQQSGWYGLYKIYIYILLNADIW